MATTPRASQIALSLSLSTSPVLTQELAKECDPEALTALLKTFSAPLPNLSFASSKTRPLIANVSTNKSLPRTPQVSAPSHSNSRTSLDDSSSAGCSSVSEYPRSTSKHIIALLTLLDKIDADMVAEVQRVKENIREARAEIREYKKERRERRKSEEERLAVQRRMTVEADSDFWAGV
ncbi:hypothetical protein NEOLEDRAFT_1183004 [Neolentinus lepideus HHB14362 ss-1]|uniref:Uncharacterized protein n=1 Tax=Neolentinus lepideus HHB14362 ss-1 TaxID=1314782 RepID=A0A165NNV0_9AGAM|nr:hypothetical protein NEOLEDRAFT_1183004 [Neolentinus lepideus HHB14362 ss-1]